ncbi:MAG: class I SAM-dependent methyltransferase, partial [Kofleriaceae bacterium]
MPTVEDRALCQLGEHLRATGYRFITPTPATHQRVNARAEHAETTTIEGALGWSRPFREAALPPALVALLSEAGVLQRDADHRRSTVRFSTIDHDSGSGADGNPDHADAALYLHSAYPTLASDAVFFGPDTYRFVAHLRQHLRPAKRLVDIGAGTGAGALSVLDRCAQIVLADINPRALRYARINATLARCADRVATVESDVLAGVHGELDAVIANPPYLADRQARTYRDGGGALGLDLSLRIAR